MNPAFGKCYLVGAGPGDLGLVTLRAKECLEKADVIVYDYLSNPQMLRWARPEVEAIYAGKKAKDHSIPQGGINQLLIEKAKQGKEVVRLKGGDPFVFGRGGEEAQELREAGIEFEIVPGITSVLAGPAYAGIPVTHRDHNAEFTIFTGHEDPTKGETSIDWKSMAQRPGTKVFLMGVERIGAIADALMEQGADRETPVAMIRWATTARQQTLLGTLGDIAKKVKAAHFQAPAITVVGPVAQLREQLQWFETRPLFGKRIVVTRTRKQAGELSRQLEELGADAYELPTIRIEDPLQMEDFGYLVKDTHTYDWLIFTSPNGVDRFFDLFFKIYHDARSLGGVRIAAMGPGTANAIRKYRFAVDLLPVEYVAEGLLEAFKNEGVENLKMLWVKAEETREVLFEGLSEQGAIIDRAIAYRTVPETQDVSGGMARFREEGADLITFTSSSTVEAFLALKLPLPESLQIASIGPITSKTLRQNGLYVDIEAREHTMPGLVRAIREHYQPEVEEA
ncbi:MAG: uroporphyrinogen-III C-methyltransferase [Verrucomicrobiota bacterium]